MRLILLLASIALVNAGVPFVPINNDYHRTIGIPLYNRLSQIEAAQDFDGGRIIGGSLSSLGAHPHLGGLIVTLTTGQKAACGSSLVTNTRLVTAAHCWKTQSFQGSLVTVVLGSLNINSGGHRVNTNNVQLHASYNMVNLNNDIAVITIPWVGYNNNIRNIPLASGSNNFVGVNAVAAGYGLIADFNGGNQQLRHVTLPVISNSDCARVFGSSVVVSSTICTSGAGGRNICSGDSGGSLVANGQLIGITSFGARFCQAGQPSGFARVTSFNSWIKARL